MAARIRPAREPNLYLPSSQLVTRRQLNQEPARRWADAMGRPLTITRKSWERVYVLQMLSSRGMLKPGVRGLGFGVGADPILPVMVNRGCHVVATDYGESGSAGWGTGLDLNAGGVADATAMARQVEVRDVDMNDIPADLRGFDFVYSCGSLEHIGGWQNGLDFVEAAMACLRPGGVAVHTTELSLSDTDEAEDSPELSLYLPSQIDAMLQRIGSAGHHAPRVNYTSGSRSEDLRVVHPPFDAPCLKVHIRGHIVTSMGFVVVARKKPERPPLAAMGVAAGDFARDATRAIGRRVSAVLHRNRYQTAEESGGRS